MEKEKEKIVQLTYIDREDFMLDMFRRHAEQIEIIKGAGSIIDELTSFARTIIEMEEAGKRLRFYKDENGMMGFEVHKRGPAGFKLPPKDEGDSADS